MSTVVAGVSLSVYLTHVYHPDCEYVNGEVVERNSGEIEHSRLQTLIIKFLSTREEQWDIVTLAEQRVQVKAARYRVPDICVLTGKLPSTPILREPPFLCIEILSRADNAEEMQDKIDDYLAMGVAHVWVVNPRQMRGFQHTIEGMREAKDGVLRTAQPDIAVPLLELGMAASNGS